MTELAKRILERLDQIEARLDAHEALLEAQPRARTAFRPPSIEEVWAFFAEHGSSRIEGEDFFDSYTSKGWMVGKTKMVNWHSSASKWIRANAKTEPAPVEKKPAEVVTAAVEDRTQRIIRERKESEGKGVHFTEMTEDLKKFFKGMKEMP